MENVIYTAPVVEVIEVEVEKGFAASSTGNPGETPVTPWP
jgi:hypothetical protein